MTWIEISILILLAIFLVVLFVGNAYRFIVIYYEHRKPNYALGASMAKWLSKECRITADDSMLYIVQEYTESSGTNSIYEFAGLDKEYVSTVFTLIAHYEEQWRGRTTRELHNNTPSNITNTWNYDVVFFAQKGMALSDETEDHLRHHTNAKKIVVGYYE